ncbi:MAG: hypothetical protein JXB29_03905 [Sedimentisphaerales bacterium]|nr:hypothetical protein [Sedimentisphaerales bacterium]
MSLTKFQRKLCDVLQQGLPICSRPFAELGKILESSETQVLEEVRLLRQDGFIRRIGAFVDYRQLGIYGTLVAAHIEQGSFEKVVDKVNSLAGVSHNYLRDHYYNLWFTLLAKSVEDIKSQLEEFSIQFGTNFKNLPTEHIFKLDVRFYTDDCAPTTSQAVEVKQIYEGDVVRLKEIEKQVLSNLQQGLKVIAEPFHALIEKISDQQVLQNISHLVDKGVIKRVGAVVNHYKLGFVANVLFCCQVNRDRAKQAGQRLAKFRIVSHCYQRKTETDWPYNLYAMMHAKNMGQIQQIIDDFVNAEKINSFEILPTARELRKEPAKFLFLID